MRYFLHIAYDGSKFRGWQRQANVSSVQEVIEKYLEQIFKDKITVYGCGRTDAGVHASQYVCHIDLEQEFNFDLKFRLNKNLPKEISIFDIVEVGEKDHARFHATSRKYDYFIHTKNDPFLCNFSSFYPIENLDVKLMKQAVDLVLQNKNYKAFCKQPEIHNHTYCEISEASLKVNSDGTRLQFSITADRFLRGMVRLIVAGLLKVGTGEISLQAFELALTDQEDFDEKKPALPNGLYLSRIKYPNINFPPEPSICDFLSID